MNEAPQTFAAGAETLIEVLEAARSDGYKAHFLAQTSGEVVCEACDEAVPADSLGVDWTSRLEGASDPADEMLVLLVRCPSCDARGTLTLGYGPNASPADEAVTAGLAIRTAGVATAAVEPPGKTTIGVMEERQNMTQAEINLTIPADSRFVATARVTAASVAAELDYSVDEIEELRVGVNELVAILVEWAEDHGTSSIDLVFRLRDDEIEVEGSVGEPAEARHESGSDSLDSLTRMILEGVVDDFEIDGGRGSLRKRRSAA